METGVLLEEEAGLLSVLSGFLDVNFLVVAPVYLPFELFTRKRMP